MLGGFAVAAGAVLVLTVARRPPEAPPDQLVRGGVTALVAVGPRGPVPRAGLTLVWFAAGPGAVYRITLSDISGKSVWTSDTRDTSVVVPTRIQLSPDTDYFWTVDATLSQGSSRTTTAQSFRVTR